MLLRVNDRTPEIDPTAIVSPTAVVAGDVRLGARSIVGHGAAVVAEGKPIRIGQQVVIRDQAVIRSTTRYPVVIGDHVLVGPHATLFGCTVEDEVFLATGTTVFHQAIVRTRAEVRVHGVVHLRTVVPTGATVPIGWIAVGDPASILPPDQHERIWEIQEPLDFPATAYGLERDDDGGVDMRKLTRRLYEAAARHRTSE